MHKQNYINIAKAINYLQFSPPAKQILIDVLIREFKKDNNRFDPEKFIIVCKKGI